MTPLSPEPPSYDSVLHRYLKDHDAPCTGCGYNLRGLTGDTCPECHQPVYIGMVLSGPGCAGEVHAEWFRTTRSWLMLLLALGVALGGIHTFVGLFGALRAGLTRRRLLWMGSMILVSLAPVIVLMLWERWGRHARHVDPGTGQSRAWAAIAAAAGLVAISAVLLLR